MLSGAVRILRSSWLFEQIEWSIEILSFSDLGVSASYVTRLSQLGINEPLPVQEATIASALDGRDICAMAPTGSGKTLAFSLPLLEMLDPSNGGRPSALVLVPTRELAAQVCEVITSLGGKGQHRAVALYGGSGYNTQFRALRRGVDVIVACPGRLEDLVARGDVKLSKITRVVIDEADRMADMGFLPAVTRIVDMTSVDRQVLLFSATMGKEVEQLVRSYQNNPIRYKIKAKLDAPSDVEHFFWKSDKSEKINLTAQLSTRHGRTLVFCKTKRGADRVAHQLHMQGVDAIAIHGDRSQSQRERALASFSSGKFNVLVATDVVARGIHVDGLDCVVHFDPPQDATDYVHRSGRTGRAGSTGSVISLVASDQVSSTKSIQKSLGLSLGVSTPPSEISDSFSPSHRSDRFVEPDEKSLGKRSDSRSAPADRSDRYGSRSSSRTRHERSASGYDSPSRRTNEPRSESAQRTDGPRDPHSATNSSNSKTNQRKGSSKTDQRKGSRTRFSDRNRISSRSASSLGGSSRRAGARSAATRRVVDN